MNSQQNTLFSILRNVKQNATQDAPNLPVKGSIKLYIKNMTGLQSKLIVREEVEKLGLHYISIDLGVVEILEGITEDQYAQLKENLSKFGLELLDGKKDKMVEKIKNLITENLCCLEELPNVKYSVYLSEKLNYSYAYLSNVFSEIEGINIREYIILNKIEKAKELLLYDELNLTDISYKLHYSSVAHLSNQFKKITGISPSFYKFSVQKRQGIFEN